MGKLVVHPLPIHFRYKTGKTCFLNCNLCLMGGHLSIQDVVFPPNIFLEFPLSYICLNIVVNFIAYYELFQQPASILKLSYFYL